MMVKKTLGPHKIHVEWVGIPYHDKEEEEEGQAHNDINNGHTNFGATCNTCRMGGHPIPYVPHTTAYGQRLGGH